MALFKKVFFSTLVLLLASAANAQLHLGVKAGANLTKINGKEFKDEFAFNYLVGGFAEIGLGKRFALRPEITYNQATSTLSDDYRHIYNDFIRSGQRKAKLNYLSIPILLNMKLIGPLHIEAGPQFSVATSRDKDFFEESKGAFKSGDLSLIGGVQLQFMKTRISGRYVAGMENIANVGSESKWKNRAIQVAVGFAIF